MGTGVDGTTAFSMTDRVASIVNRHTPFASEPFHPRSITGTVLRKPTSWFGRKQQLHPVAFMPRIAMFETMGCVSSMGGMSPYIWLDDRRRLMIRVKEDKFAPVDIDLLTDKDLEALELGIKGDSDLLDAEYSKAHQAMLEGLGFTK